MKLLYENVVVTHSAEYRSGRYIEMSKTTELDVVNDSLDYPKSLLRAAVNEFNSKAEEYHIDASAFRYVDVSLHDIIWQVDFHTEDKSLTGPHFSINEIYWNGKRREIMQSCFDLS